MVQPTPEGLEDPVLRVPPEEPPVRLCRSFSADTEVLLANGNTIDIADVMVGDLVFTHTPKPVRLVLVRFWRRGRTRTRWNSATDANQPPTDDWPPEPTDPVFETVRSTDAEYKILEQVAADIDDALFPDGRPAPGSVVPDAEGTVSIVVDSPPGEVCAACQDVIDQFSERYPNVEIQVRDLVGGVPGADG